ncbi:MAG: S8 family serine peptidase [bacterium]|nr:S8 family serine peptidase [bacterium]
MNLLFYVILSTQLYTSPLEPKVSKGFSEWLSTKSQDSKIKVWVFYTDKGIKEETEYKKALVKVEALLSPNVKKNRLVVRKPDMLCDFTDIPVYKPYMDELKTMGGNIRVTSKWLNASTVIIPVRLLSEIAKKPYVYKIEPVRTLQSSTGTYVSVKSGIDYGSSQKQLEQLNLIKAHNSGYTGSGVILGILDTGFEWRKNKILEGINVIAERDFIGGDDTTSYQENQIDSVWDGVNTVIYREESPYGQKQISHGTAMLSLLGGRASNRCIGAAFGASFALAKTELLWSTQEGFDYIAEEDWWIAGAEWLVDSVGASIISSSLGYRRWINPGQTPAYAFDSLDGKHYPLDICASQLWNKGVLLVTAMGNYYVSGPLAETADTSIVSPASADSILAVGGVDTLGNWVHMDNTTNPVTGSSIGPRGDGVMKPEVCGPWAGNYAMPEPFSYPDYDSIVDYNGRGTSDATALVAGVCACVKQAYPDWGPMKIREVIMKTASKAASPNDTLGYGIANAYAAINYENPEPPVLPLNRNRILMFSPAPYRISTGEKLLIHYQIINTSCPHLWIYTVSGKLIWDKSLGQKLMGIQKPEEWDGKTNNGERVSSGVYVCILTTTDVEDKDVKKFVVIK